MPPTLLPHHPHPALTSNPATSRPRPQPQPQPQLFITPPSAVYHPRSSSLTPPSSTASWTRPPTKPSAPSRRGGGCRGPHPTRGPLLRVKGAPAHHPRGADGHETKPLPAGATVADNGRRGWCPWLCRVYGRRVLSATTHVAWGRGQVTFRWLPVGMRRVRHDTQFIDVARRYKLRTSISTLRATQRALKYKRRST